MKDKIEMVCPESKRGCEYYPNCFYDPQRADYCPLNTLDKISQPLDEGLLLTIKTEVRKLDMATRHISNYEAGIVAHNILLECQQHYEVRIKELETEVSNLKRLMAQDKIRIGEYYGGKLSAAKSEAFKEVGIALKILLIEVGLSKDIYEFAESCEKGELPKE